MMKRLSRISVATLAGFLGLPLLAGASALAASVPDTDTSPEQAAEATCKRLREMKPPAADYPDAAMARQLENCDAEALYFGIGMPANPVRARQCALLEIQPDDQTVTGFEDVGLLTMIYANGVGAERDLPLATALACRINGSKAERVHRVNHLRQLRQQGWNGWDFSLCDDMYSHPGLALCVDHEGRLQAEQHAERFERMKQRRHWDADEQATFQRLLAATEAFANVSARNETDLSGSGRWTFVARREQELHAAFMALLDALESHSLPRATATERRAADERLNTIYRRVMSLEVDPDRRSHSQWAQADSLPMTTVTRAGVRKAQRAWIEYRDAWLAFAEAHYWQRSDSVATWLTRQRVDDLAVYLPRSASGFESR